MASARPWVFGTTFGHSDATFQDSVFLEMLSRGFLWVVGSDNLVDRRRPDRSEISPYLGSPQTASEGPKN